MASYRFFKLDRDYQVVGHEEHVCADDLAALDRAISLSNDVAVQVWCGTFRVAHVKAGNAILNERDRLAG